MASASYRLLQELIVAKLMYYEFLAILYAPTYVQGKIFKVNY